MEDTLNPKPVGSDELTLVNSDAISTYSDGCLDSDSDDFEDHDLSKFIDGSSSDVDNSSDMEPEMEVSKTLWLDPEIEA